MVVRARGCSSCVVALPRSCCLVRGGVWRAWRLLCVAGLCALYRFVQSWPFHAKLAAVSVVSAFHVRTRVFLCSVLSAARASFACAALAFVAAGERMERRQGAAAAKFSHTWRARSAALVWCRRGCSALLVRLAGCGVGLCWHVCCGHGAALARGCLPCSRVTRCAGVQATTDTIGIRRGRSLSCTCRASVRTW